MQSESPYYICITNANVFFPPATSSKEWLFSTANSYLSAAYGESTSTNHEGGYYVIFLQSPVTSAS